MAFLYDLNLRLQVLIYQLIGPLYLVLSYLPSLSNQALEGSYQAFSCQAVTSLNLDSLALSFQTLDFPCLALSYQVLGILYLISFQVQAPSSGDLPCLSYQALIPQDLTIFDHVLVRSH